MKKLLLLLAGAFAIASPAAAQKASELWRQVEIVRTAHGVPHIRAQNFRAAGYALGWLQCEDYGTATPMSLLDASGRQATVEGYGRVESDFAALSSRKRALQN